MKLRITFRPAIVVVLLTAAAILLWATAGLPGAFWPILPFALFYSGLSAFAAIALLRIHMIERWMVWDRPGRLLILAPHEDDCVISAGGLGLRNSRLGGVTRIVYLARDENPGLPQRRASEARTAWSVAGLGADDLRFLDLMPALEARDPQKLQEAADVLREIVGDFQPTTIVVPAFEGGHIHHDMASALIGSLVGSAPGVALYEAPEYSPYVSLWNTPHRILSLTARWLLGLVAYYGPPDGIDGRTVFKVRLEPGELADKRRMLAAFVSQNAPSLVATRGYPDRLIVHDAGPQRRYPFDFGRSYLRAALLLRRYLPGRLVGLLLPVQLGTVGRMGSITDWEAERGASG